MALLFSDFKSHVRQLTREANTSGAYRYATDANCLLAWKMIIDEINMLTHSNMVSNIAVTSSPLVSVANQRLYDIPTHVNGGRPMQDVYEVYYNGKPLTYMSLTEARMSSGIGNPWWNRTGDPIRYYQENEKIGLYPVPTTAGVTISVFGSAGVLMPTSSTDTTTTSQLNDRLSKAIIYAGCEYILKMRREYEWAKSFENDKKDALIEYQQVQVDRVMQGSTQFMSIDPHERF